jgi:hypothetical protein
MGLRDSWHATLVYLGLAESPDRPSDDVAARLESLERRVSAQEAELRALRVELETLRQRPSRRAPEEPPLDLPFMRYTDDET